MPGKIFINYRRGDDPGNTGRLFDHLEQAFQRDQLFRDVDSIPPGRDFVRELEKQVAQCDVLLAVIGKGWIEARDDQGVRRLDKPNDIVRIEIALALKHDKLVIPVLVQDARMPSPDELPEAIRPLARRNAVRLTYERFRADTKDLIKAIKQALDEAPASRRTPAESGRKVQVKEKHRRFTPYRPQGQPSGKPARKDDDLIVERYVQRLRNAGTDKIAFDSVFAELSEDGAVGKEEADAIAHQYTEGRAHWPKKGDALKEIKTRFSERAYQALKMTRVSRPQSSE